MSVLDTHTAGSPCDPSLKWTHLTPVEIQARLAEKGIGVSLYIVRQLLRIFGYKRRKLHRVKAMGEVAERNEQFEYIAQLKACFLARGLPVLSIDSKKKEFIGDFYPPGTHYGQIARQVYDHDFVSAAQTKVVPHGIYDLGRNAGYISLGISHDTSAFVCENLEYFWLNELQWHYPQADSLLLLCDTGGANSCRHHRFKENLWYLAQRLELNIVVAHYPSYCSKWNPIEHRLFCHLTRAWQGVVFSSISLIKELAEKTSTKTGLFVKVRINEKIYQTKLRASFIFVHHIEKYVQFAQVLPKWNYTFCYNST